MGALIPLLLKDTGPSQSDTHVDSPIGAIHATIPLHTFKGRRGGKCTECDKDAAAHAYPMIRSAPHYLTLNEVLEWARKTRRVAKAIEYADVGDGSPVVIQTPNGKGIKGTIELFMNGVYGIKLSDTTCGDGSEAWMLATGDQIDMQKTAITVAGLCVRAADTGRVLLLKRDHSDLTDPERGCYEFPGGHLHLGEDPFDGACREWSEEVGQSTPPGVLIGSWTRGIYQGFIYLTPSEMVDPAVWRRVDNPDMPHGDVTESIIWVDPEIARTWTDLRSELRGADDVWNMIARARPMIPLVKAFDETKHPRGQPENAGEFGPGGGRISQ